MHHRMKFIAPFTEGFIPKYPEISTKSGLDTECPELLSELLKKNKFAPITSKTKFKKHISNINRTKYIEEKRLADKLQVELNVLKNQSLQKL